MIHNQTDQIASKYLGKKTDGSETYDASLLVPIPRCENRAQYNIDSQNLPFSGWDVWHAYEFSALTKNGLPVTRVLKLKYNCESEFLIESKSLKLYLNSFNMTRMGETTAKCLAICKQKIEQHAAFPPIPFPVPLLYEGKYLYHAGYIFLEGK